MPLSIIKVPAGLARPCFLIHRWSLSAVVSHKRKNESGKVFVVSFIRVLIPVTRALTL
jgi:hypothetical protein